MTVFPMKRTVSVRFSLSRNPAAHQAAAGFLDRLRGSIRFGWSPFFIFYSSAKALTASTAETTESRETNNLVPPFSPTRYEALS